MATKSKEKKEVIFHEGTAPISKGGLELVNRINELNALMAPFKKEIEASKALLDEEMNEKEVNQLTYQDVLKVQKTKVNKKVNDMEGIISAYPEVVGTYVTEEMGTRLEVKK